jgi:hypothetical protein
MNRESLHRGELLEVSFLLSPTIIKRVILKTVNLLSVFTKDVEQANRLISMPSFRNRSIGMQMYKYNIVGFLHWGFNFYNSEHSISRINPFVDLSGDKWVPAGDPFSVYPSRNGEATPSLRALVFYDALQDIRAMQLCEALYSHDEVVAAAEKALGYSISFDRCAKSANELLCMRETVNAMIKEKMAKMLIFVCKNLSNGT